MNVLAGAIKIACVLLAITSVCACTEKRVAEKPVTTNASLPIKTAKLGAAIKLVSESIISIEPNQPTPTNIVLAGMPNQSDVSIQFSPSQGLSLGDAALHQVIKNNSARLIIPITLMAQSKGRYYINMHVRVSNSDSEELVRNLAVIVQVGSLEDHLSQFKKTTGENVIILPAQETISAP